ncbi:hypothetical protein [Clostridium sporogenes]|nr:hypothetical protein [Clostridium sporogenes]MCW6091335.1 hypothetical protein [Clostridium sporogenes]
MLLDCVVIGKQDPEKAKIILSKVVSELIRDGKIKFDSPDTKLKIAK